MKDQDHPDSGQPLRSRKLVLIGMMLSMGLAAMDNTIVATAIPSIVRDLGGFALFPWVFSVYLLTQSATIPIYGKLADLYGRKPVLLIGAGIFLLGSALSGFSWNMLALIIFRGIQGIGAGAVQPIVTTVIGDLYTVEERGRIQGYLSSVWGIAAVFGPALGGILVQVASWKWIFFINVPIGIAALVTVAVFFHERVVHRPHRIDYLGSGLLIAAIGAIILGLLEGGVGWAWWSVPSVAAFMIGMGLLAWFIAVERSAAEPVMPLWVFGRRFLAMANLGALVVGALTIGLSSYLPTFLQGDLGATPLVAGFALAAMSVGWPFSSSLSSNLYLRFGFRATALLGSFFTVASSAIFVTFTPQSRIWWAGADSFLMGMGLGLMSTALIVAVQAAVDWNRRGVVTGANMFTRMLGSTLGVAVFGSLVNGTLAARFRHPPAAIAHLLPHTVNATTLVLGGTLAKLDPAALSYVKDSLSLAVHHVFWALVITSLMAVGFEWWMPKEGAQLKD